uniref:Uncharacterized protein n=1 Tax=Cucumis melo TaxID=3656 RepID=A0A9I9EGG4_CUCME
MPRLLGFTLTGILRLDYCDVHSIDIIQEFSWFISRCIGCPHRLYTLCAHHIIATHLIGIRLMTLNLFASSLSRTLPQDPSCFLFYLQSRPDSSLRWPEISLDLLLYVQSQSNKQRGYPEINLLPLILLGISHDCPRSLHKSIPSFLSPQQDRCHNRNFSTRLCDTCLARSTSQPFEIQNSRTNSRLHMKKPKCHIVARRHENERINLDYFQDIKIKRFGGIRAYGHSEVGALRSSTSTLHGLRHVLPCYLHEGLLPLHQELMCLPHGPSTSPYSVCKDFLDFSVSLQVQAHSSDVGYLSPFLFNSVILRVVPYIRTISKRRRYRMPLTFNLKRTSLDQ